ncbi:ATP-binding protein [Streptomyces sp. NPDC056244]|uniref:ATP-binding protein n=1 Tax=Streptomyces sp. NPDC056244 TaxID=3345762 RepID=UPI0035D657FE
MLAGIGVPSSVWALDTLTDLPTGWAAAVAVAGCAVVLRIARRRADLAADAAQNERRELLAAHAKQLGERNRQLTDQTRHLAERDRRLTDQVLLLTQLHEEGLLAERSRTDQWIAHLASQLDQVRGMVSGMREEAGRGGCPSPPASISSDESDDGDAFARLNALVRGTLYEAMQGIAEAAANPQAAAHTMDTGVFVTIADRLHSLVARALRMMLDLQRDMGDPVLLGDLYRIDHVMTQTRRQIASLRLLGGGRSFRDSEPVQLSAVMGAAGQEIEEYARLRTGWPQDTRLMIPGFAAFALVHVLAELAENAAKFSRGRVEVSAERVSAGLVIEIEDRGLPGVRMRPETLAQLNALLAAPDTVDVTGQIKEGRIGLLVAALHAQQHGMTISLRQNPFGGTRAIVVLPEECFFAAPPHATDADTDTGELAAVPARIPLTLAAAPAAAPEREPEPRAESTATKLPRRQRSVPPTDTAGPAPAAGNDDGSEAPAELLPGGRPALTRRRREPAGAAPPSDAGRPTLPSGPATPTLLGDVLAGQAQAAAEAGPQAPPAG